MLFDNRWNQHTCTSLTLLPFGLWAPGVRKGTVVSVPTFDWLLFGDSIPICLFIFLKCFFL